MSENIGNYTILKKLGEGAFSTVYLAINNEDFNRYAIKVINYDLVKSGGMEEQVHREISIMYKMDHPGLIKLYEVMKSPKSIYLVLELGDGGALFDILANDGPLSEDVARKYFQQLIDALSYMHSLKATHRDLKPENLLLDSENNLKISDFGLSIMSHSTSSFLKTRCGTPNYVAPEVIFSDGYKGPSVDVWSAGCILYVMFTASLPFDAPTLPELARKISTANISYPNSIPAQVRDLLRHIIVPKPEDRYTINDIKNHPWFKVNYTPLVSPSEGTPREFTEDSIIQLDENNQIIGNSQSPVQLLAPPTLQLNPAVEAQEERHKKTKFYSHKTPEDLFRRINDVLTKSNATTSQKGNVITATMTLTDELIITVKVTECDDKRAVIVHRMKGNSVDFMKIYKGIKDKIKKHVDHSK